MARDQHRAVGRTKDAVIEGHLHLCEGRRRRLNNENVVEDPRRQKLRTDLGDGEDVPVRHQLSQGDPRLPQKFHPPDLKPADIIRVMDHFHRVRIVKIHPMLYSSDHGFRPLLLRDAHTFSPILLAHLFLSAGRAKPPAQCLRPVCFCGRTKICPHLTDFLLSLLPVTYIAYTKTRGKASRQNALIVDPPPGEAPFTLLPIRRPRRRPCPRPDR